MGRHALGHSVYLKSMRTISMQGVTLTAFTVTEKQPYLSRDMRFPTMWYAPPAKASDQPAHMRSLIRSFASRLNIL